MAQRMNHNQSAPIIKRSHRPRRWRLRRVAPPALAGPLAGAVVAALPLAALLAGAVVAAPLLAAPAASAGTFHGIPAGAAAPAGATASPSPQPASRSRARVKYYIVPRTRGGAPQTLFQIAARTLGSGSRFMEIFDLNKNRREPGRTLLGNPRAIEPGMGGRPSCRAAAPVRRAAAGRAG